MNYINVSRRQECELVSISNKFGIHSEYSNTMDSNEWSNVNTAMNSHLTDEMDFDSVNDTHHQLC